MEIIAIGGYSEFGRNMTCLKFGEDSILLDMGIRLDRVLVHEDTDISKMKERELIEKGIIPNVSPVLGNVKAIILTHGHLDHIGAIPILARKYRAPIIATQYTAELVKDEERYRKGLNSANYIQILEAGDKLGITSEISVEFINVTHSIPQTVMAVIETREGIVLYANDFKFDDTPLIGKKPDYERIKRYGREGVKCLITESTRITDERRTPSERIVRKMLLDNLTKSEDDKGLIVTTFSSHIARIETIAKISQIIDRKPVLLGRSMSKYCGIAEKIGILNLPKNVSIYGSPKEIRKVLRNIVKDGKEKYLLVVTGHQGEPDALLSKITNKKFEYKIEKDDQVIFSADVIPNPINVANRYALETKLKIQGARIIKGLHVSGHASREDHRDFLKMLHPENVIPCHGDIKMLSSYVELAENCGYELNKNLFLIRNGQKLKL